MSLLQEGLFLSLSMTGGELGEVNAEWLFSKECEIEGSFLSHVPFLKNYKYSGHLGQNNLYSVISSTS